MIVLLLVLLAVVVTVTPPAGRSDLQSRWLQPEPLPVPPAAGGGGFVSRARGRRRRPPGAAFGVQWSSAAMNLKPARGRSGRLPKVLPLPLAAAFPGPAGRFAQKRLRRNPPALSVNRGWQVSSLKTCHNWREGWNCCMKVHTPT
jgi:hypothetical protein